MTLAVVPLEPTTVPRPRTSFLLPAPLLHAALLQDHTVGGDLVPSGVPHYELLPLLRELEQAETDNLPEYLVAETRTLRTVAANLLTPTLWRLIESGAGQVYCRLCAQPIDSSRLVVFRSWTPAFGDGYENETRLCVCPAGHDVFCTVFLSWGRAKMC